MRLFPNTGEDLLDAESLPDVENTELNYRVRPLSSEQEMQLVTLVLFVPVPIVVILAATMNCLLGLHVLIENLLFGAAILLAVWMIVLQVTGASMRYVGTATAALAVSYLAGRSWFWIDQTGEWACRAGILLTWIVSCMIARQMAAWILVGPGVDHETMQRWRVNLPGIFGRGLSLDCPELLTYTISPLLIGPAWWLSAHVAGEVVGQFWLWPLCLPVVLFSIWVGWHLLTIPILPWPNFAHSLRMTGQALLVFLTYDANQTAAAGIFRFPAKWLRSPLHRWSLVVGLLLLLAFVHAASCPSPADTFAVRGMYVSQMLLNLLVVTISAPIVFASILWFTAGSLLARFDKELTANTEDDDHKWDNYVDRIINSSDPLEREHIFAGTSVVGDYPVLVHREIYDQHMHVLGDSGASKTSLAMGPMATQLIARADSTVVIVDLKGDKALFETCRREAARTGRLRFRWLSNEVGTTSFAFNPFLQSHNGALSPEQLVQQLLQGLSLDYGIQYGAGYFTAMNEIVLSNVLKHCGARSFRELDKHLRDQRLYAKIGYAQDWAQARHLGALVSRLAGSEIINTVPGMHAEQADVFRDAIDVQNVFEEPQVIYLWLRSALEPTNAPTIARLFLWAMFTAASHRPNNNNRVYFFVDEIQQIISDGIKLIFEQFRDLGGTIIAAHQTAGQLRRQGTDLGETIDSCTAVKQVFRASDLFSVDRLEKLSGTRRETTPTWYQPYERGTGELIERYDPIHAEEGLVRVQEAERPRLDRRRVLEIGSERLASMMRFTFGSGYTQFAGATVPVLSQYPISFAEYQRRRAMPWPTAPGAFPVQREAATKESQFTVSKTKDGESDDEYLQGFNARWDEEPDVAPADVS